MFEKKKIFAPGHLSTAMKEFYRQVCNDYELEGHRLRLLKQAAECYDRAEDARLEIKLNGITFKDKFGQIKPNPACKIETENKNLFARLLRELRLDIDTPSDSRLPRITGDN
jgi:phage terminase small subunit